MYTLRIHEHGGPEVFREEALELPAPSRGEVRLRHTAIGLNYIETYQRTGLYPVTLPAILGGEAAGVVETVAEGVTDVAVGDRVAYAAAPSGAYASARNIAADRLVRLPTEIDDDVAAAMMLKGMTAEYLLRRTFPVQPGQTIVVHAAAGGVGLILCQWARSLGATVIGTVGDEAKATLARSHGCAHTILYRTENVAARVRELTSGRGVPVVYDSVGRDTFVGSLDSLAPRGMLVSFGNASGVPPAVDLRQLAQRGSLYVTRPTLFTYVATRDELLSSAAALFDIVRSGAVKIEVRQRFALRDVANAHRALESRATVGASILVP